MTNALFFNRHAVETVNRSLQDICTSECPFGGITVVLGGDFQQTLPVMVKALWEDTVLATVQWSHIWHDITVLHLTQNMRLSNNPQQKQFAQWLLELGHGNTVDTNTASGPISPPTNIACADQDVLIWFLYGTTPHTLTPPPYYFYDRVLLAPLNNNV
jgi:hypothetical protein